MSIFSGISRAEESLEIQLARKKAELDYINKIVNSGSSIPQYYVDEGIKKTGEVAALQEKIKMRHSSATG